MEAPLRFVVPPPLTVKEDKRAVAPTAPPNVEVPEAETVSARAVALLSLLIV